jgi:hypothetical protein
MARINIEEKMFDDPRFNALQRALPPFVAEGIMLRLFKMAQFYWCEYSREQKRCLRNPIPKQIYKFGGFPQEVIDVGLVEEVENGFYVRGSEEHFSWLIQKKESGSKGGTNKKFETENTESTASPPLKRDSSTASMPLEHTESDTASTTASSLLKHRSSGASSPLKREASGASPPLKHTESTASPPLKHTESTASPPLKRRSSGGKPLYSLLFTPYSIEKEKEDTSYLQKRKKSLETAEQGEGYALVFGSEAPEPPPLVEKQKRERKTKIGVLPQSGEHVREMIGNEFIEKQLADYSPDLVKRELEKIAAWCQDNDRKLKSPKVFVANWFEKIKPDAFRIVDAIKSLPTVEHEETEIELGEL